MNQYPQKYLRGETVHVQCSSFSPSDNHLTNTVCIFMSTIPLNMNTNVNNPVTIFCFAAFEFVVLIIFVAVWIERSCASGSRSILDFHSLTSIGAVKRLRRPSPKRCGLVEIATTGETVQHWGEKETKEANLLPFFFFSFRSWQEWESSRPLERTRRVTTF